MKKLFETSPWISMLTLPAIATEPRIPMILENSSEFLEVEELEVAGFPGVTVVKLPRGARFPVLAFSARFERHSERHLERLHER